MNIDIKELTALVVYQLGALAGMAAVNGHPMTHMSFHGALGNRVAADAELAGPLVAAVAAFDSRLIISSSSSRAIEAAADKNGLRVATSSQPVLGATTASMITRCTAKRAQTSSWTL